MKVYPRKYPHFNVVSAMEDPYTICLVLEDCDKDMLDVTLEINEHDLIERIISLRSRRNSDA